MALSTTCKRSSDLCTTEECPVDEHTQYLWQVSVVAPPTPVNQTIDYDVISVTPLKHVGVVSGQFIDVISINNIIIVNSP